MLSNSQAYMLGTHGERKVGSGSTFESRPDRGKILGIAWSNGWHRREAAAASARLWWKSWRCRRVNPSWLRKYLRVSFSPMYRFRALMEVQRAKLSPLVVGILSLPAVVVVAARRSSQGLLSIKVAVVRSHCSTSSNHSQPSHCFPWLNLAGDARPPPCPCSRLCGSCCVFFARQKGLNVVIVSMDDQFLADTFALVSAKFPGQEFRKVGATFSPGVDYMDKIK